MGFAGLGAVLLGILIYPRDPVPPAATPASHGLCGEIHARVCSQRGLTVDPTGYVSADVDGELQALRLYEEIILQNPEWTIDQHEGALVQRIYAERRRARVEAAFGWVRSSLLSLVERQPEAVFSAREKRDLRHRLKRVRLELPAPGLPYADEPDLYTKNDVFYERTVDGSTRLRVGGAYLFTVTSWFNLVFTLAHELAHAVDPCELRAAGLSFPAFDRLSACLMGQGVVDTGKSRSECGENDQLSEAVVDWLAVQVTSEALAHFATEFDPVQLVQAAVNSVRDLCDQDDGGRADVALHPSPEVRIDRIFGRNPRIRALLGCLPDRNPAATAPDRYCGFDSIPSGPVRRIKPSPR